MHWIRRKVMGRPSSQNLIYWVIKCSVLLRPLSCKYKNVLASSAMPCWTYLLTPPHPISPLFSRQFYNFSFSCSCIYLILCIFMNSVDPQWEMIYLSFWNWLNLLGIIIFSCICFLVNAVSWWLKGALLCVDYILCWFTLLWHLGWVYT